MADELVNDAINRLRSDGTTFNPAEVDKNIRRRVYDALNVFSSMGFVQRNGKQVVWVGTSGFLKLVGVQSECECVKVADQVPHTCSNGKALSLKSASERLKTRIQEKRARLEELRWQEECVQRVVRRNASKDASRLTTSELRVGDDLEFKRPDRNRVDLPFVMVSAAPSTSVSVQMEDCRERIVLGFDGAFRLWDGYSIVGRLVKRDRGASELGILYDGAATREEDEGDVGSASQSDGAGASL